MRQNTKELGLLSLGVYSTMSFATFCGCLYSVTQLDVTKEDLTKVLNKIRMIIGLEPIANEEAKKEDSNSIIWQKLPDWAKSEQTTKAVTNVLLAMGMTKLFAPIKIGITAAIVPSLARRLRASGWMKSK